MNNSSTDNNLNLFNQINNEDESFISDYNLSDSLSQLHISTNFETMRDNPINFSQINNSLQGSWRHDIQRSLHRRIDDLSTLNTMTTNNDFNRDYLYNIRNNDQIHNDSSVFNVFDSRGSENIYSTSPALMSSLPPEQSNHDTFFIHLNNMSYNNIFENNPPSALHFAGNVPLPTNTAGHGNNLGNMGSLGSLGSMGSIGSIGSMGNSNISTPQAISLKTSQISDFPQSQPQMTLSYSLPQQPKEEVEKENDPVDSFDLEPSMIDPPSYGLPEDFPAEAVYEFFVHERMLKKCKECKQVISLIYCFYSKMDDSYVCVKCASLTCNDGKRLVGLSWEPEEDKETEGYIRCRRLAHYKPLWSFLNYDKQKAKKKMPVGPAAASTQAITYLKIEKQCFYCRNYKRWEYLQKRNFMKIHKEESSVFV